jgi:hypothetical protein
MPSGSRTSRSGASRRRFVAIDGRVLTSHPEIEGPPYIGAIRERGIVSSLASVPLRLSFPRARELASVARICEPVTATPDGRP